MRQWIRQCQQWISDAQTRYPSLLLVCLVVVILGCVVFMVRWFRPAPHPGPVGPRMVYFYDTNDQTLFPAMNTQPPMIPAPSGPRPNGGPAGARARVFACGGCDDTNDRFIGWLEAYTEAGRAQLTDPQRDINPLELDEFYMVAPPPRPGQDIRDLDWHPYHSPPAAEIMEQRFEKCGEQRPVECFPPPDAEPFAEQSAS